MREFDLETKAAGANARKATAPAMPRSFCGPLFPGVDYLPMNSERLKNFILDVQKFGFTSWRKMRLLQAVGRFCQAFAIPYTIRYGADITEFCGAAWVAINKTIGHFDPKENGGFLTLLAFWLRAEYNGVIFTNYTNKRYSNDKVNISFESIYKTIFDDDERTTILDTIKDTQADDEQKRQEQRIEILSISKNAFLSKRENDFLSLFIAPEKFNLSEISSIRNTSREYYRQIKNSTIKKLRTAAKNGTR